MQETEISLDKDIIIHMATLLNAWALSHDEKDIDIQDTLKEETYRALETLDEVTNGEITLSEINFEEE